MLVAGVLGAFVVFVAQSLSWLVLGVHDRTIHRLPNGEAIAALLREAAPAPGVYHHPGMPLPGESQESWAARYRTGPVVPFLAYQPGGTEPFSPVQPLRGWILDVVSATIVAWLLSLAAPSLPGYAGRVAFVTLFGVFAACVSWLSTCNWMSLPVDWTVVMSLELVASWALVGLVLAWRIRPDAVTPTRAAPGPSRRS